MTTIYLQKNRGRRRSGLWFPVFLTLTIAIVCGLLIFFAPHFSSSTGSFVARPLWIARNFVGNSFDSLTAFVRTRQSVLNENKKLQSDLDKARADLIFYDTLAIEHQKLLEAFGRVGEISDRKLATVIAKPPQSPYDTVVIDIGERDGVAREDSVYSFGNIILGTIAEVQNKSASATLFSSPGTETHTIVERSDLAIILTGLGGGSFEARVPQDADIAIGDVVIVPSIQPSIVGRVVNIEATPASSFKHISVQSPVNVNHIRWVEVDTK